MTPAKLYAALVALKDRLVEAYVRGMAAEQAERHPMPPLGTCAICGRSEEPAAEAHARGTEEERQRWLRSIIQTGKQWAIKDNMREASAGLAAIRDVIDNTGIPQ